jgi:hypothetical protein
VRNASKDEVILADGFSCREQIRQTTDRHALHFAQVVQMALRHGVRGPVGNYPEQPFVRREARMASMAKTLALLVAATAGFVYAGFLGMRRVRKK